MTDFSDVIKFVNSGENAGEKNNLTPLKQDEISRLRTTYAEIPSDFLEYLAQVGAGSVNNCRYMVYGDLLNPSDIFSLESVQEFENSILLFGDDFTGNPAGFLVNENWRLAEILHEDLTLSYVNSTFGQFIKQMIGMNDDE